MGQKSLIKPCDLGIAEAFGGSIQLEEYEVTASELCWWARWSVQLGFGCLVPCHLAVRDEQGAGDLRCVLWGKVENLPVWGLECKKMGIGISGCCTPAWGKAPL